MSEPAISSALAPSSAAGSSWQVARSAPVSVTVWPVTR